MPTFTRSAVVTLNNNLVILNTGGQITFSSNGSTWSNANVGTGQTLRAAAFGLGTYIVVGDGGFIGRATSLSSWASVASETTQKLNSVEFGAGRFRAVGDGGVVLSSTDGVTFSVETSGTTQDLLRVRYINNRWVAVGTNGALITSVSGSTWTNPAPSIDSRPLYGIAYKAGMTYPYTAGKKYSSDGVNWISAYNNNTAATTRLMNGTGGDTMVASTTDTFNGYIAAAKFGFVCGGRGDLGFKNTTTGVGGYSGKWFYTSQSTDGLNWRALNNSVGMAEFGQGPGAKVELAELNGSVFGCTYWDGTQITESSYSNRWLDAGLHSTAYGSAGTAQVWSTNDLTSTNQTSGFVWGETSSQLAGWALLGWGRYNPKVYHRLYTGAYGNGYYLTIGTPDSAAGAAWSHRAFRATGIAFQNSPASVGPPAWLTYSTVYTGATNTVVWPIEAGTWNSGSTFPLQQFGMAFGNGRFVVVGPRRNNATSTFVNQAGTKYFTVVYSSDNGATWTSRVFTESAGYDVGGRVAGSAAEIVMSAKWYNNGTPGWVLRTTDCVNYTAYYTGYASDINEIKYLNGWFYTVHDNGGIARSSNGITWTTLVATSSQALYGGNLTDVYYIGGQYIVTSDIGVNQSSPDLAVFNTQNADPGRFYYWDGAQLITVNGSTNMVRVSTNGTTWTDKAVKAVNSISKLGATYFAINVGESRFFSSTDLISWTDINLATTSGVGIILKDASGLERLQSYDPSKANYLCTRVVQENYVTADGTTVYVPAANGYKIFVMVTPADAEPGGVRIPYIEYRRGGAPDYTPYFIVRYPAWGGSGSSSALSAVWCTVFTTGVVEKVSY